MVAGLCEGDPSDPQQLWEDIQRELKEETGYTGKKIISKIDSLPLSLCHPSLMPICG